MSARRERTKWLYISVSAAMTMLNVVNPNFWERKIVYRTNVLPVRSCSRNGYELCRLDLIDSTLATHDIHSTSKRHKQ